MTNFIRMYLTRISVRYRFEFRKRTTCPTSFNDHSKNNYDFKKNVPVCLFLRSFGPNDVSQSIQPLPLTVTNSVRTIRPMNKQPVQRDPVNDPFIFFSGDLNTKFYPIQRGAAQMNLAYRNALAKLKGLVKSSMASEAVGGCRETERSMAAPRSLHNLSTHLHKVRQSTRIWPVFPFWLSGSPVKDLVAAGIWRFIQPPPRILRSCISALQTKKQFYGEYG